MEQDKEKVQNPTEPTQSVKRLDRQANPANGDPNGAPSEIDGADYASQGVCGNGCSG